MARVVGGAPVVGTISNVTFYMMNGINYMRKKSSLTAKRVSKDKAFEKTRQYASNFGLAAQIGSLIYQALPMDMRRERWFYRAIAGEAASLLYEGKNEEEVQELLWKKYITDTGALTEGKKVNIQSGDGSNINCTTQASNLKMREAFYDRWFKQDLGDYWFKRAWPKRGTFNQWAFRDGLNSAIRSRTEAAAYK